MAKKIKIETRIETKKTSINKEEKIKKIKSSNTKKNITPIFFIIAVLIIIVIFFLYTLVLNDDKNATSASCFLFSNNEIKSYDSTCSKDVIIPQKINGKKVKRIGKDAFYNLNITSVELPNTVEIIKEYAFAGNNIKNLVIPNSVKKIYNSSFFENEIENLVLGSNLEFIGTWSFGRNNIEKVVIPDSVKIINYRAFCTNNLKEVVLGKNIEKMEPGVFQIVPNSVDSEGNTRLNRIINKSGKSFDWDSVLLNNSSGKNIYVKGNFKTTNGTILITIE